MADADDIDERESSSSSPSSGYCQNILKILTQAIQNRLISFLKKRKSHLEGFSRYFEVIFVMFRLFLFLIISTKIFSRFYVIFVETPTAKT